MRQRAPNDQVLPAHVFGVSIVPDTPHILAQGINCAGAFVVPRQGQKEEEDDYVQEKESTEEPAKRPPSY